MEKKPRVGEIFLGDINEICIRAESNHMQVEQGEMLYRIEGLSCGDGCIVVSRFRFHVFVSMITWLEEHQCWVLRENASFY